MRGKGEREGDCVRAKGVERGCGAGEGERGWGAGEGERVRGR